VALPAARDAPNWHFTDDRRLTADRLSSIGQVTEWSAKIEGRLLIAEMFAMGRNPP
jgi:hypothetical protein